MTSHQTHKSLFSEIGKKKLVRCFSTTAETSEVVDFVWNTSEYSKVQWTFQIVQSYFPQCKNSPDRKLNHLPICEAISFY